MILTLHTRGVVLFQKPTSLIHNNSKLTQPLTNIIVTKLIQAIFGTAVIVRFFLVLFIGISDLNVMVFTEACMCT